MGSVLEVISKFDPFLKAHIEKCGNALINNLIWTDVRPHRDNQSDKNGKVFFDQCRFHSRCYTDRPADIHYAICVTCHSGESLCQSALGGVFILQNMGIDINNCRAKCYDNATNMSGIYRGLQTRIKKLNPLIKWVPCTAHTLNLVGVNSINHCFEMEDF